VVMIILINKVYTNISRSTGDVAVIFVRFSTSFYFLCRLSVTPQFKFSLKPMQRELNYSAQKDR
jgi:hypothetical protein